MFQISSRFGDETTGLEWHESHEKYCLSRRRRLSNLFVVGNFISEYYAPVSLNFLTCRTVGSVS